MHTTGCTSLVAEHEDSGEVCVGDHPGGVRCADEAAEVQERAGQLQEWVRRDCCGAEVGHANEKWDVRAIGEEPMAFLIRRVCGGNA